MQITVIFIVFSVTCIIGNQSTKEPHDDESQKITSKITIHDSTTNTVNVYKNSNYLWANRLNSDNLQNMDDSVPYITAFKAPYSVTRLAKSLASGFDPYFYKGHFEPFERRPKPVTLVAFRKNGFLPRSNVRKIESKSMEIAELQSPYNDVSSFWQDDLTT